MTKYMYCIPEGGFNTICQIIWKCYEYCLKYNRILVIDTRYVSSFRDDIRKYFIFTLHQIFDGDIDRCYAQFVLIISAYVYIFLGVNISCVYQKHKKNIYFLSY